MLLRLLTLAVLWPSIITYSIGSPSSVEDSLPSTATKKDQGNIVIRYLFAGGQVHEQASLIDKALKDLSLLDSTDGFYVDDAFITMGFSFGAGVPRLNVSFGLYGIAYLAPSQYHRTSAIEKSLRINGFSYGFYLEKNLQISKRVTVDLGLRFLNDQMNLELYELKNTGSLQQSYNDSKVLAIRHRSNSVNPYLLMGYRIFSHQWLNFSAGLSLDYKYTLRSGIWKSPKKSIYNQWAFKNSNQVVDIPYYGNNVVGMGLYLAVRGNFQ